MPGAIQGRVLNEAHSRDAEMVPGTRPDLGVFLTDATGLGLLTYRTLDLDETGQLVVAGAYRVYGYHMMNRDGQSEMIVKLYDHVNAPTAADTPLITLAIPALGNLHGSYDTGIIFTVGIGMRATTGIADNDVGAPGANDVVVNLFYKAG